MTATTKALRGAAISIDADPFLREPRDCLTHHEDALTVISDGIVTAFGPYDPAAVRPGVEPERYEGLLCPGFIDAHVHYPQMQVIGAYGTELLEWLTTYTFPAEQSFADDAHAARVAGLFLRELLRAGTTTAVVYCTVHPGSVDAFFAESARFNTRMIAGKVLMDRNAPPALLDTAERGYTESRALIERWHGVGRQLYCVTPRFAPTSTEAQLDAAGALVRETPGVFTQTHLCENRAEIEWVRELFPARESYLDVYAHAGLVGPRSMFGHAIHMHEGDFQTCHDTGAALAFCPTSNLFLGSGLFRLYDAMDPKRPVRVGLGTDVGGGTSLSQLRSLDEAYKVVALSGAKLDAVRGFWLATAGGAEALRLGDRLGRIAPGYEADLVVLDPKATPFMAFRTGYCQSIEELLFALMIMGDDRAIRRTYVAGERVYDRDRPEQFRYP
ncbi:guanine deaminase [Amaricoccus solimangrovi]|uniref:Guanine deaminase n=1 Tax=Amaricoccus solimangrovi TaxID=2589815 RepID=A0A501WRE7_9RHOB|nr:guanine deaminase [Amaricoccus solimangrovi]TPE51392.1 guanine deaminase [Amaricoccus solimangrovi]